MSSSGKRDTCHFGHLYELSGRGSGALSSEAEDVIGDIRSGELSSFKEFEKNYIENEDSGINGLVDIMGARSEK